MATPTVKQIQGTATGFLVILASSPFAGIMFSAIAGELKSWRDILPACIHGSLWGAGMASGWIWLKSPLAPTLRDMVGSVSVTSPDGTRRDTLFAAVPEPVPGQKTTTTIDKDAGTIEQKTTVETTPKGGS